MKAFHLLLLCTLFPHGLASLVAMDDLFEDRYSPDRYASDRYGHSPSHDLGKAVIASNRTKARNCFIEAAGGAVLGVSGNFVTSMHRRIPAEAFTGSVLGSDFRPRTKVELQSYDDIYNAANEFGLRFGRRYGYDAFYFRVTYTSADSSVRTIGNVGDAPLRARFSDYEDWGILFGFQREFMQPSRVHPYSAFEIGARFVDRIGVDLSVPGATPLYNDLNFYDDSVVFTVGVTLGIAYDVTEAFRIGVETGLRYQTQLRQNDSDLDLLGLHYINDGDGWSSVPLYLTGRYAF